MHRGVVHALRSRGVTVITALEAGLNGARDEDQLAFAAEHECVLYSHNASDFHRLHTEWVVAGRGHAGMILAPQQRFSVGERLRRILCIRAAVSAERMKSWIEFLTDWS